MENTINQGLQNLEAKNAEFDKDINVLLEIFNKHKSVTGAKKFDIAKVQETIEEMADYIIKDKNECTALKEWMKNHDFYKSPASTKFHGDWESGLAVHSLMVTVQSLCFAPAVRANFQLSPIAPNFDFNVEDVFVSAICHDFCKSGSYKIEYHNTKDIMGNWTKKPVYRTKPELRNLGHGNESVLLLLESMPSFLSRRLVIEAISRHMGFSDLTDTEKMNYSNFLQNPLVILLQLADQTAAAWWDC